MQISIQLGADSSISEQIRTQVAAKIAARELRTGDRLTPPAELAEQLVASPAAVLKAYRGLESDGLCRRGERGFEVAPSSPEEQRERARRLRLGGSSPALIEELELARNVQRRLMPPASVVTADYEIAARVHAAELVSGDFYDLLERDRALDVVVADVSGKGVAASLVMAFVKARLSVLPEALPVGEILSRLNRRLRADLGPRHFVAMACARLHGRGRVELANAGLPYPLLLRSEAAPEPVVGPQPSLPLGVRAELEYRSAEIALGSRGRLLFYSDGIPEAPTAAGEPLGYREVAKLVAAHAARPARAAAESALAWLDGLMARFAARTDSALADDQTALVVTRRA